MFKGGFECSLPGEGARSRMEDEQWRGVVEKDDSEGLLIFLSGSSPTWRRNTPSAFLHDSGTLASHRHGGPTARMLPVAWRLLQRHCGGCAKQRIPRPQSEEV